MDWTLATAIFLVGGFVETEIDAERLIHLCDGTLENDCSARDAQFDNQKPIRRGEAGNPSQIVL